MHSRSELFSFTHVTAHSWALLTILLRQNEHQSIERSSIKLWFYQFLTAILKQFNPRDKNAAWSKIEYILNNKTYDNTVKLSEDSKYSFDLLKYDKSNDTIIWRKKDSQNPNTENKLSKTQFMAKTYNNLTKSL